MATSRHSGAMLPLTMGAVDLKRGVLHGASGEQRLSASEARLLTYLADNPNRDIPRIELQVEVLGYSETVQSRAIDKMVHRMRGKVERDATNPDHILSVYGIGYRFVPMRAQQHGTVTRNLPRQLAPLVGRMAEVVRLDLECERPGLITVVGPPGVGKTRVAVLVAEQRAAKGGEVVFCDASRAVDREQLAARVARCLRISSDEDQPRKVTRFLASQPVLLLIDHIDHLVDEAAEMLAGWASGGARVLLTSRRRLGVPGERLFEIGPLEEADAVALLETRALEAGATWPGGKTAAIRQLVARLDCNPLAIEVAAARTVTLSPAALLERLDPRLGGLQSDRRLDAAIAWSWELLEPWQASALQQVAVFDGGFSLQFAESVLDLSAFDGAPPIWTVVSSLLEHSLLRRFTLGEDEDDVHFALYEVVRAFALRQPRLPGTEGVPGRHASHRARWLADATGERRWLEPDSSTHLALGLGDVLQALRFARDDDPPLAAELILGLQPPWREESPAELASLADRVVSRLIPNRRTALVQATLAEARLQLGDPVKAQRAAARAEQLAAATGATDAAVVAALVRIRLLSGAGRTEEARVQATAAIGPTIPPWLEAELRVARGEAAFAAGNDAAAERDFDHALALYGGLRSSRGAAWVARARGALLAKLERAPEAANALREAIVLHRDAGERIAESLAHLALGEILVDYDDLWEGVDHLDCALQVGEDLGLPMLAARASQGIALATCASGDPRAGLQRLIGASAALSTAGSVGLLARAYLDTALAAQLAGEPERAVESGRRALQLLEATDLGPLLAEATLIAAGSPVRASPRSLRTRLWSM